MGKEKSTRGKAIRFSRLRKLAAPSSASTPTTLPSPGKLTLGQVDGLIVVDGQGRKLEVMRCRESLQTQIRFLEGHNVLVLSDVALRGVAKAIAGLLKVTTAPARRTSRSGAAS